MQGLSGCLLSLVLEKPKENKPVCEKRKVLILSVVDLKRDRTSKPTVGGGGGARDTKEKEEKVESGATMTTIKLGIMSSTCVTSRSDWGDSLLMRSEPLQIAMKYKLALRDLW